MKIKILIAMLALIISISLLPATVLATPDYNFVIDESDVLSDDEEQILEAEALRIYEQAGVKPYIALIPDTDIYKKFDYDTNIAIDYMISTYGMDILSEDNATLLIVSTTTEIYWEINYTFYPLANWSDGVSSAVYNYLWELDYPGFVQGYLSVTETAFLSDANATANSLTALESLEIDNVMDTADILTDEEEQALREKAQAISAEFGIEPYILTIDDYGAILDVSEAYYAATEFYSRYDLGYGEAKEGIMLMLSMSERDYAYITYGDEANKIFHDNKKIELEERFLTHFGYDDWYAGFDEYLDSTAYTIEYGWRDTLYGFIVAFFIALIPVSSYMIFRRTQLKSVRSRAYDRDYVPHGGINMQVERDTYTHTTTKRSKIQKSSGGGGGGGRSFSGGGFSGRSGKF